LLASPFTYLRHFLIAWCLGFSVGWLPFIRNKRTSFENKTTKSNLVSPYKTRRNRMHMQRSALKLHSSSLRSTTGCLPTEVEGVSTPTTTITALTAKHKSIDSVVSVGTPTIASTDDVSHFETKVISDRKFHIVYQNTTHGDHMVSPRSLALDSTHSPELVSMKQMGVSGLKDMSVICDVRLSSCDSKASSAKIGSFKETSTSKCPTPSDSPYDSDHIVHVYMDSSQVGTHG